MKRIWPPAEEQPDLLPEFAPPPQTIGVVVTCHNYSRYLRECLDSILSQTIRPESIILVDDASDDDTPAIAQDYAVQGVQYLRVEFRDVALGRNAGAALCGKPGFYCFVDADDVLPPNYLEVLRAGMTDPRIAVTYPHCDTFDGDKEKGRSPYIVPFDPVRLRRQNFACATSLVRRQALEQVDGWRSYKWGLHDWDLWQRIVAAGWTMKLCPDTALRYRIHGASMSDGRHGHYESMADVMSETQLTAVVTLFSGRKWALDRWFADLAAIDWTRGNLHLVAVDNSRNPTFAAMLRERLAGWRHTYLQDDSRIDEETPTEEAARGAKFRRTHQYAMGVHIARLYSLATRYLPASAANVWSVEDDVGLDPPTLRTLATEFSRLGAAGITGCLRSRFDNRLIAFDGRRLITQPEGTISIDKTGFFCLLARREAWERIAWRPGTTGTDRCPWYDWAACADLIASGRPLYLVGDVRLRHWQADGTCITV